MIPPCYLRPTYNLNILLTVRLLQRFCYGALAVVVMEQLLNYFYFIQINCLQVIVLTLLYLLLTKLNLNTHFPEKYILIIATSVELICGIIYLTYFNIFTVSIFGSFSLVLASMCEKGAMSHAEEDLADYLYRKQSTSQVQYEQLRSCKDNQKGTWGRVAQGCGGLIAGIVTNLNTSPEGGIEAQTNLVIVFYLVTLAMKIVLYLLLTTRKGDKRLACEDPFRRQDIEQSTLVQLIDGLSVYFLNHCVLGHYMLHSFWMDYRQVGQVLFLLNMTIVGMELINRSKISYRRVLKIISLAACLLGMRILTPILTQFNFFQLGSLTLVLVLWEEVERYRCENQDKADREATELLGKRFAIQVVGMIGCGTVFNFDEIIYVYIPFHIMDLFNLITFILRVWAAREIILHLQAIKTKTAQKEMFEESQNLQGEETTGRRL